MVAGQPAAAGDPTDCSLDDPPPGLHREALLALLVFNDFDGDGRGRGNALGHLEEPYNGGV